MKGIVITFHTEKKESWLARKQPDKFLSYAIHSGVVEIKTKNRFEFYPLANVAKLLVVEDKEV